MRKVVYISVFAAMVVMISACSGSKDSQSYVGRVYHNTTSHYNGYYYAKLKMTEDENQVIASRKEDYDKLLPIYLAGNPEDNFPAADMDSIVKRLTVVVKLHPKSKWTDDCFFIIGKAYFYHKDYEKAMATFKFVSSQFKDESTTSSSSHKKKKKKSSANKNVNKYTGTVKEEPEHTGFVMLKKKPLHYTDVLWLVRATAMYKRYGEANAILNYLDEDKSFPAILREQLQLMHAFVSIEQKQYKNAIEPMKQAIRYSKSKKETARYTYILAQLYQLSGDFGTAGKTFALIPGLHPSYDMDFNSRISVVKNYIASGSGSPAEVINLLQDMAKNSNFESFYDQIYYYIGLVELKQGKSEAAVQSFETSVDYSSGNANQKGLSYLKIGEMSMADQDYLTAAPYYDSAANFLSSKFDTLNRVKELKDVLGDVVKQTQIITAQDSLQRIANMPDDERNRLLDQMARKLAKENQQAADEGSTVNNVFNQQNQQNQQSQSGGSWYFYNPTLRAAGFNEFVKKWGTRENSDNWRRSNKKSNDGDQTANADGNGGNGNQSQDAADAMDKNSIRAKLLANLPTTAEKMAASNKIIFEAYYSLGTAYRSDLYNMPKSVATFEKLAARFDDDSAVVKVYYNLLLLYQDMGNTAKAEAARQRILSGFPHSVYAAILLDADYFKKEEEKKNVINTFYASTYSVYQAEQYSDVFARVKQADSLFKPNPLAAKFDLLQALAIGRTQDRNAYIAALDTVVNKFSSGEEHDKALEILTALGAVPKGSHGTQNHSSKNGPKNNGPSPYKFAPDNPQYLVVYFNTVSPKIKAIADSISNYNSKNHSNDNLRVQPQLLDKNTQIVVVKQFKNKDDAMSYYDDITDSETMFESVEDIGYRVFVIDNKSFIQFYQRKNMSEYISFFDKYYEGDDSGE